MFARFQHKAHHHAVRINETVSRAKRATDDVVNPQLWNKLRDLVAGDQFYILNAQCQLAFAVCFEIFEMALVGGAE